MKSHLSLIDSTNNLRREGSISPSSLCGSGVNQRSEEGR